MPALHLFFPPLDQTLLIKRSSFLHRRLAGRNWSSSTSSAWLVQSSSKGGRTHLVYGGGGSVTVFSSAGCEVFGIVFGCWWWRWRTVSVCALCVSVYVLFVTRSYFTKIAHLVPRQSATWVYPSSLEEFQHLDHLAIVWCIQVGPVHHGWCKTNTVYRTLLYTMKAL